MIVRDYFFKEFKRLIPSHGIIYASYVFGTEAEREQLTILSADEIKDRLKQAKASGTGFIKVTKPENKAAFDKFQRAVLQSVLIKKEEPQ